MNRQVPISATHTNGTESLSTGSSTGLNGSRDCRINGILKSLSRIGNTHHSHIFKVAGHLCQSLSPSYGTCPECSSLSCQRTDTLARDGPFV